MKKILFLFAALCLTQAGIVMAADTDLTAYSNVIYVASATINPSVNGNETTLSIRMNNTAQIRGFQFDLYLPEGMTAVKSSKGKFAVSLNKARLAKDDEHTLTVATQSDGAIRFLCGSQYDETFTGTSGEIATIKVNVAGLKAGKYPITLKAVKLCETNINHFYEIPEVVTTFTVRSSAGHEESSTDYSAYSNVIYVAPATINPSVNGNETTLSICMNNMVQIRGFQFDMYLPEGMTAVKSSKDKFIVSLNKARLTEDDEHTLTVAAQSNGAIRFLCGSQYDETFTGTSGEIATIKVNVAGLKAGKYPITLKAVKLCETNINNYYEVAEIVTTFTVSYTKYLQDRWIQSISDQTYTGKALKPTVTVKDGKTKLTQGTDYTVVYSNNINAGTATVTVTAKKGSGYDGKATATFTIAKADITMTTAPAAIENLLYTDKVQTLISAGEASFGNVLYSLDGNTYSEDLPTAIEPGTYTIYYKVEGDDNHNAFAAQTVSVTIATNKTALNSTISEAEGYYDTFKESYPDIADALLQAINAAKTVQANADATQQEIETATTNLKGAIEEAKAAVTAISAIKYLQDAWIQSISDQTYTGEALEPTVTVKDGETTLTLDTDYTVAYSNNINAGTATVTVTAKEGTGYDGKATATFTIAKAEITMTTAPAAIENLVYTDKAQTLISAGEASFGNVLYSLDGNTYSEDLPTAIEPGTYTIYYKVEGDDNHNAFAAQTVSVTIATNKTALNSTISEAEGYYDTFKESYPDIADALLQAINAAKTVQANADATQQEIETATTNLKGAIEEAKAAAEQAANQAAANAVIAKIADIGEVAYTDECKALIDAAREAYDALTDTQKELVTNDEVLTDAEATYADLKTAADQAAAEQAANQAAANAVIAKIADIGEVAYTDESKALIDAARAAYDALTDTQKELVTNYNVLTDAEATYADLKTAADQAAAEQAANQAAANAVIAKIADIGEVAYTDDCKALIDAAREAYDALTETQKELVANYNVLTDAEKTYADLEAYTGINDTPVNDAIKEKGWYDMNGHRLAGKPTVKGMYVKDGKKVIITF